MIKKVLTIPIVLVLACGPIKPKANNGLANVWIEILPEESTVDEIGGIKLHFKVVNNSNDDITILKPRDKKGLQVDFFSNAMVCQDVPIWMDDSPPVKRVRASKDLCVVKKGGHTNLVMDGRLYNWLACDSDSVEISISYNALDTVYINQQLQYFNYADKKKYLELLNKVSKIKFKSTGTKFKLNR